MISGGIFISGVYFSFQDIASGVVSEAHPVLQICRDWLQGKTYFELQTSGSTGVAKKILVSKEQLLASAKSTAEALEIQQKDSIYLCLSHESVGGFMQLIRAMVWQIDITLVSPASNPFVENTPKSETLISLVPLQLFHLFQNTESVHLLNNFRCVLLGGAAIHPSLFDTIINLKPTVYHTYGMTETCSHIALKRLNHRPDMAFIPLKGIEIGVSSENCLWIKGKVTGNVRVQTTDIAAIQADGSFEILGRKDDFINSGGIKINRIELEEKLQSLFPDEMFFFDKVSDVEFGERLILIVQQSNLSTEDWKLACKKHLPKYHQPKQIFTVDAFELTKSGKIDRIKTKDKVLHGKR